MPRPQRLLRGTKVRGAQSLRRGLLILRTLAEHQATGLTVTELAKGLHLERPTVHRLLNCLVEESFVFRDATTRRFRLGTEILKAGVQVFDHAPLLDDYIMVLRRVATETGDTAVMGVRQGDYWYCLHREEGTFPVRVLTLTVGGRQLLGTTAPGLAILARLPDPAIQRLMTTYRMDFKRAKLDEAQLLAGVAATRRLGYARSVNEVTPGTGSVGVAFSIGPDIEAAVGIGTITMRLTPARCERIARVIMNELRAR
jgi:DNA-binding IclR family transcriptional regulator